VIRVSGPRSLEITRTIASFLPVKIESHKVYFGTLHTRPQETSKFEDLDEVLITYFQKGRSFTGEEVLEISCHGNPQICERILNQLIQSGARAADRGEFTYRAFMNGNVDLVQAESVLALIESQSDTAMKLALRQLKGQLSEKLLALENDFTWLMAHIEAGIDFSTEGLELVSDAVIVDKLSQLKTRLKSLVDSYRSGRIVRDGLRVAFAGKPNVGKSSLLNLLLEEERAIVTEIAGTTRDVISGETAFQGVKFTFLDTAGIRAHSLDLVEQLGMKKSHEAHAEADVVIFVYDLSAGLADEDFEVLKKLPQEQLLIVGNKLDKMGSKPSSSVVLAKLQEAGFENLSYSVEPGKRNLFFVSALDETARPLILQELCQRFSLTDHRDSILLSNARHFENLNKALANVIKCEELVSEGLGSEFLAIELKEALMAVQETLGKRFDDQVMDRVFKEFCLGK
jgi:tRNA modification GTPase